MSKKMSDSERYDRMRRLEKEAEMTRRRMEEPTHKKEGRNKNGKCPAKTGNGPWKKKSIPWIERKKDRGHQAVVQEKIGLFYFDSFLKAIPNGPCLFLLGKRGKEGKREGSFC